MLIYQRGDSGQVKTKQQTSTAGKRAEAIINLPFEVEHIRPTSRGGADDPSNLALSCRACNLYKSDRVAGVDEATGEAARLFDPRCDAWEAHFAVDRDDGSIRGRTPEGRATVAGLGMNRDVQREARRAWMRLGLY